MTDPGEPKDPTDPKDATDQADPTHQSDPTDQADRTDQADQSDPTDQADQAARGGGDEPAEPLDVRRGEWSLQSSLRDGTPVLLRQIRPEDRDRLADGLRQLSSTSRYLRFHADVSELSDEQLDYLTNVDHVDHEAIVAIDVDRPEVPGVGVARYIRDGYERHVAEAAITVADEYQGQGAGTILLGALAARAREHGVEVFRNFVLASNESMLAVFDELGATREPEAGGIWRVDLPVPSRASDVPASPAGKAFMAAAKEEFRFCSLFPPVLRLVPRRERDPESVIDVGAEADGDDVNEELDQWLADRDHRTAAWPLEPPERDDDADALDGADAD